MVRSLSGLGGVSRLLARQELCVSMNSANPLGKYAEIVASIVAVAVIATSLALFILDPGGIPPSLNDAFWVSVGIVFGTRAATNGAGRVAAAAHARLDAIGAPPVQSKT